jgi:Putative restriction endonuclease
LIEVADTSLEDDRAIKAPLYDENGIVECWIVNLIGRVVEVYRRPEYGRYADAHRLGLGEILDIVLLPGVALRSLTCFPCRLTNLAANQPAAIPIDFAGRPRHKPRHPGHAATRSSPNAGATPLREGSRSGA